MAGGDGLCEGPLKQHLRQPRLGVDIGALAEQNEAGECEQERCDEAGHWLLFPSLRGALATKQSILSFLRRDGLLRFARNDDSKKSRARPGGRVGRARLSGGGWAPPP